jgi:hypothetical protein
VSFQFKYLGEVGTDSKEKSFLGGWKLSSMKQFKPKIITFLPFRLPAGKKRIMQIVPYNKF